MSDQWNSIKEHYTSLIYIIEHFPPEYVKPLRYGLISVGFLSIIATVRETFINEVKSSESYYLLIFLVCLVLWFLSFVLTGKAEEKILQQQENKDLLLGIIDNMKEKSSTRKEILESARATFKEKYPNNNHIDTKIRTLLRELVKDGDLKQIWGDQYSLR